MNKGNMESLDVHGYIVDIDPMLITTCNIFYWTKTVEQLTKYINASILMSVWNMLICLLFFLQRSNKIV